MKRSPIGWAAALALAGFGIAQIEDADMVALQQKPMTLVFVQDADNPRHHWSPAGTVALVPPTTHPDTGEVLVPGYVGVLPHNRIYTYISDTEDVFSPIAHVINITLPGAPICDMTLECARSTHDPQCERILAFRLRAEALRVEAGLAEEE